MALGSLGAKKVLSHFWLDRGQDLTIDVVKKIDREEQRERRVGAALSVLRDVIELPIAVSVAPIVNHKPMPPHLRRRTRRCDFSDCRSRASSIA